MSNSKSTLTVVVTDVRKKKTNWLVTTVEGYQFLVSSSSGDKPEKGKSYEVSYEKESAEDVLQRKEVSAEFQGPLVLQSGSVPTTEG